MSPSASDHTNVIDPNQPRTECFTHDWADTDELAGKIVMAVADVTGKDELAIERLYDRLDPESLNQLFNRREADRQTSDGLLVFSLEGCTVTVYGSGFVMVQG